MVYWTTTRNADERPTVTYRTPFLSMAMALLLVASASAWAGDVEDCRSKAQMPNEARIKACNAVIDGKQAPAADVAFAYYRRAMTASSDPKADPGQIMADVNKAVDIDPKLMEAYAFRALGYNKALQYDKAIADLSSAIALAPDRWGLYSLRAMIHAQNKDPEAALADYRSALEHNPPATSAEMIRQRMSRLEQDTDK